MRGRRAPLFLVPGSSQPFPDPRSADDEGLVAIGGDLEPSRLLEAYRCGIFPWFDEGMPPLWWSPNPRAILELPNLHVSRSLRRATRRMEFQLTFNQAFERVIVACGERQEGTWIVPEMVRAYTTLHRLGAAHSLEVWRAGELVGGLYGVQVGALFAAESMFHAVTGASKVALVAAIRSLSQAGVLLFDVQFLTSHLASMGAIEVTRDEYLRRVAEATARAADLSDAKPSFG